VPRNGSWLIGGGSVVAGGLLLWLLVWRGATLQAAVATVAAVIAACATVASSWLARKAAEASAATARDARLALGMHNPPIVHGNIVRDGGIDGARWTWVLLAQFGPDAARVELTWLADGRAQKEERALLRGDEIWVTPVHVEDWVQAKDIERHVSGAALSWEDGAGRLRWRSTISFTPGEFRGMFSPERGVPNYVESLLPGVNNTPPTPVAS
jgi:hypothetical protein